MLITVAKWDPCSFFLYGDLPTAGLPKTYESRLEKTLPGHFG